MGKDDARVQEAMRERQRMKAKCGGCGHTRGTHFFASKPSRCHMLRCTCAGFQEAK